MVSRSYLLASFGRAFNVTIQTEARSVSVACTRQLERDSYRARQLRGSAAVSIS